MPSRTKRTPAPKAAAGKAAPTPKGAARKAAPAPKGTPKKAPPAPPPDLVLNPPGFDVNDGEHLQKTGEARHLGRAFRREDGKYVAYKAVKGGYRDAGTHADFASALAALAR